MLIEDCSYFQEEKFKKNLALYEQMLNGGQSVYLEADELTDIAEYYLIQNKPEEAYQCIEYALNIYPNSIDPLIFLARQKMFSGDLEGAKLIRDNIPDPQDREVIFLNIELLLREQNEKAVADYLAEAESTQEDDQAQFAYDVSCLFLDYGHVQSARKWARKALLLEPQNKKFIKLKADILLEMNMPEQAVPILNDILDNDPYNLPAWHTLSEAYFLQDDFAKTVETTDFVLAIDEQDTHALLLKANSLFHLNKFEEAHQLYVRYIDYCTPDETPYLFDGLCLMQNDQYEEALAQLQKAEEIAQGFSPEQQQIYIQLSQVCSRLHRVEKAIEYIEKAHETAPLIYDIELYKGHILLENGQKEEAYPLFQKAIERNKENPFDVYFFIGISLIENNEYGKAKHHFQYLVDQDKSPGGKGEKSYAYLAFCEFMLKNTENFICYLKIACEKDPSGLKYTLGNYIPPEIDPKDYYEYTLNYPGNSLLS